MLGDVGRNTRWVKGREIRCHAGRQKSILSFVWNARPIVPEVSEIASANMQFRRQNSNQRQARPLPEAETGEELFAHVLQGGLYAVNGRNRHGTNLTLTSAP